MPGPRRLLFSMLLWLMPTLVQSAEFRIAELSAQLVDANYVVAANIDYQFSEKALEALQNGVPLTLELRLRLRRADAWYWTPYLVDRRLRYRIRYQALASLFQVLDLQTGEEQNFATRRAALQYLGSINGVELLPASELHAGREYTLALRAYLDIESLPLLLRPMAYITPAWNLESEWSTWSLRP